MNSNEKHKTIIERLSALRKSRVLGFAIVAIVAFSLGLMLSGGGDKTHDSEARVQDGGDEPDTWTCSMHPQIKLPKPGQCPICYMDLIPLETGGGEELDPRQIRMSETAKQIARIETVPVTRAFAEAEIRMVGKLAYDETEVAYISAWVPGRLDKLHADFTGFRVSKGDPLVYMYSPELLAAQEELVQALAAVKAIGDTKSTVLSATAEATVEAAREKLRLFGLADNQIQDIESSGKTADHLTIFAPIGGVVVGKDAKEGMYVETGTRIYTIADLSKLWVLFEAYESDLPWLRYGQRVAFTSLSFPGETSDAIISFIDPVVDPQKRTVKVRAIVDNRSNRLKPDMFVSGSVKSRLDNSGMVVDENLAGKWISPMHPEVVKDRPGTCDVCGMPLVPAESLGYAGQVIPDADAPLLIPATAPLLTGTRAVVYVELESDEGPLFEGREVQLGPRAGAFYVVKSGLEEGEMVVTNGAFKIDSELQIQARPSMMYEEGAVGKAGHDHGQQQPVGTEPEKHEDGRSAVVALVVKPEAVAALSQVYDPYFDLQMALADDNLEAAISAFAEIESGVGSVDMSLFDGDAHMTWMRLSEAISDRSATGRAAEKIEDARDAFYYVSKAMIELHDAFKHSSDMNYYLTFCPMARGNKGAYWLQTIDTVYNSFYGASMLRCGVIKSALEPAK